MTQSAEPSSEPAQPARRISFAAIAPLVLFAMLAGYFFYALHLRETNDASVLPSPLIGKAAPQFALAGIDGLKINGAPVPGLSTSDLGNGKVSVVNVWASWCVPCREEQPLLATLSERLKVPLFGINQKDAAADASRFLQNLGNPFQKIGADTNGRVSIDWGVYGVPETYVVDGSGKIAYKYIGPLTEEAIDKELRPAVERAAKSGG